MASRRAPLAVFPAPGGSDLRARPIEHRRTQRKTTMFKKPPTSERISHGVQQRDLHSRPAGKKSAMKSPPSGPPDTPPQRNPEPRLPFKHVLNPPIVTIFG